MLLGDKRGMANGQTSQETPLLIDGQLSFGGGVNSDVPRTKAMEFMPDGVKPNQLSWAVNISTRGGGIGQRDTLHPLVQNAPWTGRYQGGLLYQPDTTDPILLLVIGGKLYRIRVDTDNSVTDLNTLYGVGTWDPNLEHCYFSQAEMFAVIQAGDYTTLPWFYDFGVENVRLETFRSSNGLVNPGNSDPNNEIPAAGPMDYYAQRLWYAFGTGYAGGDIARNNTSGTAGFDYRDSVLKLTENPIAYGGDAFALPTREGNIRAMAHGSNMDSALGESQLFIFTRRAVYACSAPVTRDDWTAATTNLAPLQKVILNKGGSFGERCVVPVNGDLFFQSPPNGDIRSVQSSLRYSGQWLNKALSSNERRVMDANDRGLLSEGSGILFDNRLWQTALPIECPAGVGHQAVVPLNFDTINTFEEANPPAWEGVHDFSAGPYILQLFEGDFGGRERAFAVVWSVINSAIEVWEIRNDLRFDNGENRVTRMIEFPAYPFGDPMQLKELVGGEIWMDKILGEVQVEVYYRPDAYACWQRWWLFSKCAAKDCREDVDDPCPDGYPTDANCESDSIPIALPKPIAPACLSSNMRPATWGYQFQVRLVIRGWCRIRGLILHAIKRIKQPYYKLAQETLNEDL